MIIVFVILTVLALIAVAFIAGIMLATHNAQQKTDLAVLSNDVKHLHVKDAARDLKALVRDEISAIRSNQAQPAPAVPVTAPAPAPVPAPVALPDPAPAAAPAQPVATS